MEWIFIPIIIIFIAILILKNSKNSKNKKEEQKPYIKKDALFSPAERSFLGVLKIAVDENAQIFGKVRVIDAIDTKKGLNKSERTKAKNKIISKHFDFILCDKKDLSILCAIELNDSSHNSKDRIKRDDFLRRICKETKLPLIEIKAQRSYNTEKIKNLIEKHMNK